MSQETPIGSLNNVSDEDSKLVESILNDLNNDKPAPPSGQPQGGEQMTPEQMKAIQMQRQMAMQQQQQQQNLMAQQQNLQQQQRMNQQRLPTENTPNESDSLIENIKKEAKSILLVIFLSLLFNLEQIDNILKMSPSLFLNEAGTINIQGILLKSIFIGLAYYVIKTYLL